MRVRGITAEDFLNYKLPSMFIASCYCDFKCCTELGVDIGVCQNAPLSNAAIKDIDDAVIFNHFVANPISKAVVIGGMEPFLQTDELIRLIAYFREHGSSAPFVIYTGYNPDEIRDALSRLKKYENIIVKFGRFIPDHSGVYDAVLGVKLSSDNQYAKRIS